MLVHRHILLAEMHGWLLKIDLGLLDEDVSIARVEEEATRNAAGGGQASN